MSAQKKYRINDVVDVYVKDLENGDLYIQFYFINTRRKIGLSANSATLQVIKYFINEASLDSLYTALANDFDSKELAEFAEYLMRNNILVECLHEANVPAAYSKEENFVKEWVGQSIQSWPYQEKVLIVGCGAIGGMIAEILVRSGIQNLYLLDYKYMDEGDRVRHPHFTLSGIGKDKAEVLAQYLQEINPELSAVVISEKITPRTSGKEVFIDDYDLIINTADEPYIGYTSILLGRFAKERKIPLYVPGGFDAHLFSTGDFYDFTNGACVECTAAFFTESLKNWKPTYFQQKPDFLLEDSEFVLGGAGGSFAASLFSASYAAMNILNFIHGGSSWKVNVNRRGEFNNSTGLIDWIDISRVSVCEHNA